MEVDIVYSSDEEISQTAKKAKLKNGQTQITKFFNK